MKFKMRAYPEVVEHGVGLIRNAASRHFEFMRSVPDNQPMWEGFTLTEARIDCLPDVFADSSWDSFGRRTEIPAWVLRCLYESTGVGEAGVGIVGVSPADIKRGPQVGCQGDWPEDREGIEP